MVCHAVHPCQLKGNVRLDEIVASVQASSETLLVSVCNETLEQLLCKLRLATLRSSLHGILVELVVYAQLHALLPAEALLINESSNSSKLHDIVLLDSRRELQLVEVVVRLNGVPQTLKVMLLNEQVIDRFVDSHEVGLLHRKEVWLHQRKVLPLSHDVHDPRVVDSRREDSQEVAQKERVLVQVEGDRLVEQISVGDLDGNILECNMLPSFWGVVHHHVRSIVILVVLDIQERESLPVHLLLAHADQLWDVDLVREELEVLHQLI
mmetsp:Transcript_12313/g.34247  ORF Transcript_12313/g.34247 Transcript_12313/m.34247 type:complete len:266 (-) Transcript_12313:4212-5009(-)